MKRYALPTITAAYDFVNYVTAKGGSAAIVNNTDGSATRYVVSDTDAPGYGAVEMESSDES